MYAVLLVIARCLVRLFFRVKYIGRENMPNEGRIIICCNHKSYLDAAFMAVPFKRQIHFMAMNELFKNRLLSRFFYKLGVFPVKRGTGDIKAIRNALEVLNNGNVLGIFPQGKRVLKDVSFEPKEGVSIIAVRSNSDVLPMSIYYEGKLRPFKKITVRIGNAIKLKDLELDNGSNIKKILTREIKENISSLLEGKY